MSARRTACAVLMLLHAGHALAYRPFDSTDAEVAQSGEFELELGPLGRLEEGPDRVLVAPAVVGNIGFSGDRELVLQGQREVAEHTQAGEPHSVLVDDGIFIKQVLRRGALQDESGPSIATEYGLLLPDVHGVHGTGLSLAGIVSQRSDFLALHLNAALALTREHEPDVFLGAILEGPRAWAVRPVAEIFAEQARARERINSALVGAIWRLREGLSLDAGVRAARAGEEPIHEIRLGLTWAFSFRSER